MKYKDINLRSPMPPPSKCHWRKGREDRDEKADIEEQMYPKPQRVRDPQIIRWYREEHPFCEVCGARTSAIHHLTTRGAFGGDEPSNLIALCFLHHNAAHNLSGFNRALRRFKCEH